MSTALFGAPEWRARSGRVIKPLEDGTITFQGSHGYLAPRTAMDAEEYFQAKRDEDLGRWRWSENPDWVGVEGEKQAGMRTVVLVNERTLERFWINERAMDAAPDASIDKHAARAYFEAHSERKPWQSAEPREVWIIRTANVANEVAVHVTPEREFQFNDGTRVSLDYAAIEEARCIWPVDEMAPAELHAASSQAGLASIRGGL